MSKKKHRKSGAQNKQRGPSQKQQAPAPRKNIGGLVVIAAIVVILIVIIVGSRSGGVPEASPEEARYIGRLLPAGYQPPTVADPTDYTSTIEMAELTVTPGDTQLTVPVAELTAARIALFKYQKPDGAQLPLIAYVKPSGALFVGVSYCPPCQGEWQTIQADGTLTCNACGTKRDLESMVGISGACKLYPLDEIPVTIAGDDVVIERAGLDTWTPQPLDRKVG
ncbi:MAG: DUF2318 domain-containing protein [Coriobacteriia bacterium]|nr:DUF2318 domain-containing protein [Coriobacteriia bacterium]